jgi:phosphoserine phosphatase
LTTRGVRQAAALAERLGATIRADAIYASPMSRTLATAEPIAKMLGVSIEPEPRLLDIDYGEWHGLTPDEARTRWPHEIDSWFRAPHLTEIPGGERLSAVNDRISEAFSELTRRHRSGTIVLVTHDTVCRVILLYALGLPLSAYWHLAPNPCCINELDYLDERFVIRRMNDTAHLENLPDG